MRQLKLSALLMLPLFAIFLLASCKDGDIVEPPATADEAVSGFFMMDENTPISAAKLEVTDMEGNLFYTGITKEDGNFTIEKENVPQDADKYVVTFSKDAKVIQQVKLNTLVEASKASAGKGNVFLDDEYEYNLEWPIKMIDQVTKEPIENVVVKIWTTKGDDGTVQEYTTDAEGLATLKLIESYGYPKATFEKEGYLKIESNGFHRSSTDPAYPIYAWEMEPIFTPDNTTNNTISVFLRLMHADENGFVYGGGYPLCARKVIIKGDNGFVDSAYTGSYDFETGQGNAGDVVFTGLKSGVYTLSHEATVGEYEKAEVTVQVFGDKNRSVSLESVMQDWNQCKDNVLIIKLKDENGNPITDGTVSASAFVKDMWKGYATIDKNGTATLTGVPKGEEMFLISAQTATKTYKKATTKAVIFRCGETVTIEQTLVVDRECDETICNHKTNIGVNEYVEGRPHPIAENLCGVKVVVTGPNGFAHSEVTDSKESGRVFLENLCPGIYTATVESDEYESTTIRFLINCWGSYIPLDEGGSIVVYKKK